MPVTTIDPKPALIVIDRQKGVTTLPAAHPVDEIVARAASLATAFARHGLRVVLVNVTGRAPDRSQASRHQLRRRVHHGAAASRR